MKSFLKKAALRKEKLKKFVAKKKSEKVCGKCRNVCSHSYICCKICDTAFDQKYLKLTNKRLNAMRNKEGFVCSSYCYNKVLPFSEITDIDLQLDFFGKGKDPAVENAKKFV